MTDLPHHTEVIDVEHSPMGLCVWLDRGHRFYFDDETEVVFVGDTHPDIFQKGERYRYVQKVQDGYEFEHVETNEYVTAYREDVAYYLINGGFHIDE